jgi:septum formation topological specificity factor MinE
VREAAPDAETQTISAGTGVKTTRRIPVRGLSRLTTYARGKEILILGPGSAGKTKFAQYLQLGALDPEGQREMTYCVTKSPAFVVNVGQEQGLMLEVRRAVDTPGQVGPVQHANLVADRQPHALIVMLDCSSAVSSTIRWLHIFCSTLDTILRRGPYAVRRLKAIVVVLNKRDKISSTEVAQLRQAVTEVLQQHLSVPLGADRVRSIPILECISVQTKQGTALIDEVISELAERWARWEGK